MYTRGGRLCKAFSCWETNGTLAAYGVQSYSLNRDQPQLRLESCQIRETPYNATGHYNATKQVAVAYRPPT